MESSKVNIQFLDTLRALALLGVIIIHVSTPILKMTYGKNMEFWWIGNSVDSCVRFVIAMFLMLSGATMLGKTYKLGEFYRKRFMRVLVPFLFWSAIYCVYLWLNLSVKTKPTDLSSIANWAFQLFVNQGISRHFWYVYMIVIIYIFMPFLGKAVRKLNETSLWSILIIWIIINTAQTFQLFQTSSWSALVQQYFGYLQYSGYLVLGYQLMKVNTLSNQNKIFSAIIFVLTILIAALSTWFLSKQAHKLNASMYGSLTPNTMLQSVALFLLLKDRITNNKVVGWLITQLSNYSYGIYLVHVLIINLLFDHKIFWTMAHPLLSLPAIVTLVLIISCAIIFVLHKIPFLNYISG
jgi:surface polysaccharide O-acyltransferase-like enzyme